MNHKLLAHPEAEEEDVSFSMKVVKKQTSLCQRQVMEAVYSKKIDMGYGVVPYVLFKENANNLMTEQLTKKMHVTHGQSGHL